MQLHIKCSLPVCNGLEEEGPTFTAKQTQCFSTKTVITDEQMLSHKSVRTEEEEVVTGGETCSNISSASKNPLLKFSVNLRPVNVCSRFVSLGLGQM